MKTFVRAVLLLAFAVHPTSLLAQATTNPIPAAPELELVFEDEAVVVRGAKAGETVVLFGVNRHISPDDAVLLRRVADALVADATGEARFELEGGAARQSMWVAVDLATGTLRTAAPQGYRVRQVSFRGRGLGRRADDRDALEDMRSFVEILGVRPGVGAWTVTVGDGSPIDEDLRVDGRLEVALDNLQPLGDSPAVAPDKVQRGDVVVLMDPNAMELTIVSVDR